MINEQQHDAIAAQAYLFWEKEGQPGGRSLDHWLAAERKIMEMVDTPAPAKAKVKAKPAASKAKAPGTASKKKKS